MEPKKETYAEWTKRLEDLRKAGKRVFDSYLDPKRISFDLSVLRKGLVRRNLKKQHEKENRK